MANETWLDAMTADRAATTQEEKWRRLLLLPAPAARPDTYRGHGFHSAWCDESPAPGGGRPDAASYPVPLHPDAYVSRCGRCGAWVWMDDPCGVCLDAALRDYGRTRSRDAAPR